MMTALDTDDAGKQAQYRINLAANALESGDPREAALIGAVARATYRKVIPTGRGVPIQSLFWDEIMTTWAEPVNVKLGWDPPTQEELNNVVDRFATAYGATTTT